MKKMLFLLFAAFFVIGCRNEVTYKSVSAPTFAAFISDRSVQLVDARTMGEYIDGHIPGAQNIDVHSESFDAEILQLDKSRPVAIYCRGGRRSKVAAERLIDCGFNNVVELDEGILSWEGELAQIDSATVIHQYAQPE